MSVQVRTEITIVTSSPAHVAQVFHLPDTPAVFERFVDAFAYNELLLEWVGLRPVPELGLANRSPALLAEAGDPTRSLLGTIGRMVQPEEHAIELREAAAPTLNAEAAMLDVPVWVNGRRAG